MQNGRMANIVPARARQFPNVMIQKYRFMQELFVPMRISIVGEVYVCRAISINSPDRRPRRGYLVKIAIKTCYFSIFDGKPA
jgi:hypothetical protein